MVISPQNVSVDERKVLDSLDEVFVLLQPQVCLKFARIVGFETLARLGVTMESRLNVVMPDTFIPIFEAEQRMAELTERVLAKSLDALSMIRQIDARLTASINLSMQDLENRHLPASLERELLLRQLPAQALTFEITETSLSQDMDTCLSTVHRLKGCGCSLSMDDFGTGYASLKQLSAFPFDELKIDRAFIGSIGDSAGTEAIVDACIGMAKALKLRVVAEGIESESQHHALSQKGCDIGQGYFYAKPMTVEDFCEILEKQTNADSARMKKPT